MGEATGENFSSLPIRVATELQALGADAPPGTVVLWDSLTSCIALGLSANASLALSVGQLQAVVQEAQGGLKGVRGGTLVWL